MEGVGTYLECWIGLHVILGGVVGWVTGNHKGWEMNMSNLPGHVCWHDAVWNGSPGSFPVVLLGAWCYL